MWRAAHILECGTVYELERRPYRKTLMTPQRYLQCTGRNILLDSPASRFIDGYVIPTLVASCFIPGAQGVAVPRALVATCSRIAPAFERIAVSYGATQIYRELNKFFKEQFKGDSEKSRVQNTENEVKSYLNGLKQTGCLGKWMQYGKYWASKFVRDCEYRGRKFHKGELVCRDRCHNEIELFRNENEHLGAIEPKKGTLYKGPDNRKTLR